MYEMLVNPRGKTRTQLWGMVSDALPEICTREETVQLRQEITTLLSLTKKRGKKKAEPLPKKEKVCPACQWDHSLPGAKRHHMEVIYRRHWGKVADRKIRERDPVAYRQARQKGAHVVNTIHRERFLSRMGYPPHVVSALGVDHCLREARQRAARQRYERWKAKKRLTKEAAWQRIPPIP